MADYLLGLGALGVVSAGVLLLARGAAGPSSTTGRMLVRVALAVLFGLVAVGAGTYRVSKSRSFQLAGRLVRSVNTDQRIVALTFDDGPRPGYTEQILRVLEAFHAPATFYLTGRESEENPLLLRAIIDAGHELGNHSYSHRRLYFLSAGALAEEIERTDAAFRTAGYAGPITFRPPGCKRLLTAPLYLARHDRTTVTWDLEPDSIPGVGDDPETLASYVVDGARPGSIVLMHVMYPARAATRDALPVILEGLSSRGFRFVTVSELLEVAR